MERYLEDKSNSLKNDSCMTAGYPFSHFHDENFNKSFGMKSRVESNGLFVNGNINASPGDSGGVLVCLDKSTNRLKAVGII